MSCYDEAVVSELVGIFILNKLSNILDKNSIGLYFDNSLGMFDKLSATNGTEEEEYYENL